MPFQDPRSQDMALRHMQDLPHKQQSKHLRIQSNGKGGLRREGVDSSRITMRGFSQKKRENDVHLVEFEPATSSS